MKKRWIIGTHCAFWLMFPLSSWLIKWWGQDVFMWSKPKRFFQVVVEWFQTFYVPVDVGVDKFSFKNVLAFCGDFFISYLSPVLIFYLFYGWLFSKL
jgi:hypothetical protein